MQFKTEAVVELSHSQKQIFKSEMIMTWEYFYKLKCVHSLKKWQLVIWMQTELCKNPTLAPLSFS